MLTASALADLSATADTKVTKVDLLADLKALTPKPGMKVLSAGKSAVNDGRGGLYYWDETSTAAEDATYLNVVAATGVTTGRWKRFQTRNVAYPQGTLEQNGLVIRFYTSGQTDANGDVTFLLTDDGLATGSPIFFQILFADLAVLQGATNAANAVQAYFKSISNDKRTIVVGTQKPNLINITAASLPITNLSPVAAAGSGVTVNLVVTGTGV